jgi:hypothetical protein
MGGMKFIMFITSDPPDKVMAYYTQALDKAGWKLSTQATPSSDGKAMGNWSKGSAMLIVVTSSVKPSGYPVTLSWLGS